MEVEPNQTSIASDGDHNVDLKDMFRQVKMWQQGHFLRDSGIQTAVGTNTPSVSSKFGLDDVDTDDRPLNQRHFNHWPSFPLSVNPTDSSLLSPATPSTGSILGVDSLGDVSNTATNVDFRGTKLPEIDTDEAANAIPDLVKLIKDEDDQVIIYQSSMMVFQLSKSEAIDALIQSMDMIECIISALGKTDDPETVRFLSGTLYNMSQTQTGLKAIFASNCVPCLVNLLNSTIESVLFYAITTLHNLLLHQEGAKAVIRQSRCLQKMTILLRKKNIKFLTICTDCLQILAYGHQESKLQILSSGGPLELVKILKTYQYEKLLWTTARVLKVLSVCSSNKPAIIAAGGMDALAKHLHSSSHRLVLNCLWALRNLSDAATSLTNQHALLHSLVQILDCVDSNMVTCAAGVLSNLTCNNHSNKFIVYKYGGIHGLLRAISQIGAKEDILEPCMCALRHLTSRHEEEETARHAIVHELSGLSILARILHAATAGICPDLGLLCQFPQNPVTSWMLIKAMVGLLRNLSVNIESHHRMRDCGLVTGLFLLLYATQHEISKRSCSAPTQTFATMVQNVRLEEILEGICGALHMLAKDHATRSYLSLLRAPNLVVTPRIQPGCSGLAIFVHLLFSPHESIQRAAAGVLAELSQDRDGLDALANFPGAIARFNELIRSRNDAIATYASAVVIRLTEERKNSTNNSFAFPLQVDTLNTPPLPSDQAKSYQIAMGQSPQQTAVQLSHLSNASQVLVGSTASGWSHQFPQDHFNFSDSPPCTSLTEMLGPPPATYKGSGCANYSAYSTDMDGYPDQSPYICPDKFGMSFDCSCTTYPTGRIDSTCTHGMYPQIGATHYAAVNPLPDIAHHQTNNRPSSTRRSGYGSVDTSGYISPSHDFCMQQSPTYKVPSSMRQLSQLTAPYGHSQSIGSNLPPSGVSEAAGCGYLSPELMSLDDTSSDWLPGAKLL